MMKPDWSKAPEWATRYCGYWEGVQDNHTYGMQLDRSETRPADPYAELKKAASDPTKQIRVCDNGHWYCWHNSDYNWSFDSSPEDYEIRDKPKVKTAYRRLWMPPREVYPTYPVWITAEHNYWKGITDAGYGQWLGPIEPFTYEEPAG